MPNDTQLQGEQLQPAKMASDPGENLPTGFGDMTKVQAPPCMPDTTGSKKRGPDNKKWKGHNKSSFQANAKEVHAKLEKYKREQEKQEGIEATALKRSAAADVQTESENQKRKPERDAHFNARVLIVAEEVDSAANSRWTPQQERDGITGGTEKVKRLIVEKAQEVHENLVNCKVSLPQRFIPASNQAVSLNAWLWDSGLFVHLS